MAASSSGDGGPLPIDVPIRGGRQQRKRKLQELEQRGEPRHTPILKLDSYLSNSLVRDWSWGFTSAPHLQAVVHRAFDDMKKVLDNVGISEDNIPASWRALASLGNFGKIPGNIARELRHWLGEPIYPPPRSFNVNVKISKPRHKSKTIRTINAEMLEPHVTFSYIFHNDRQNFDEKLFGLEPSDRKLEEFWSEVIRRRDPRIKNHPMCKRNGWMRRAIPFSIHGDGIPVIRVGKPGSESLECISIQSLLGFGPTLQVKFLLYAMFENNKVKAGPGIQPSIDTVWKMIAWSLDALYNGEFPKFDWNGDPWDPHSSEAKLAGKPLCSTDEKYFGVLWSIKGDLDWFAKGLGLKNYNRVDPCEYCPATREGPKHSWPTNFADDALWKSNCLSTEQWRAVDRVLHRLFAVFSFLSQHNLEADELHVLHLGVLQHFLGSVLWLLTFELLDGSNEDNWNTIWGSILDEYTDCPSKTQYTALGISSFVDPKKHKSDWPRLKGRGCEIKSLVVPLARIWKKCRRTLDSTTMWQALWRTWQI